MSDNLVTRIVNWLRAGYPQGVPQQDYIALFGVLQRHLTEAEVESIARQLGVEGTTDEQVRDAIRRTALQRPSDEDVRRVHARLAAGGWPLAPVSDEKQG